MTSPWRTLAEAAEYLRFRHDNGAPDMRAARRFLDAPKQRAVLEQIGRPLKRRGNALLVHVDALEAVLTQPRRRSTRAAKLAPSAPVPPSPNVCAETPAQLAPRVSSAGAHA